MRLGRLTGSAVVAVSIDAARQFMRHDMMMYASALSFRLLLAIFPFLLFLMALLGFLGIPQFFDWVLSEAQGAFPDDVFKVIEPLVGEIRDSTPGELLSVGIVLAVWASSVAVRSLMNALNVVNEIDEARPMWKLYPLSVLYTGVLAVLFITVAGLMFIGSDTMNWLAGQTGMSDLFVTLWTLLRWPILVVLLTMLAALVYDAFPNIDQPFRLITPGAIIAVSVWVIASIGFSFYVTHFADFAATYGSLSTAILLLVYFQISNAVLLAGAELNAALHRFRMKAGERSIGDQPEAS